MEELVIVLLRFITVTIIVVITAGALAGFNSWGKHDSNIAIDIESYKFMMGDNFNVLGKILFRPVLFIAVAIFWIAFWFASGRFIPDLTVKGRFDHWRKK